jgi:hypothetical protein
MGVMTMPRAEEMRRWARPRSGLLALAWLALVWPDFSIAQPITDPEAAERTDRERRFDSEERRDRIGDRDVSRWAGSREMRGERRSSDAFGPDFPPRLQAVPDGEFNRIREELLARRDHLHALGARIEENSKHLEEMHPHRDRRSLEYLRQTRDRLGHLHGSVDELVNEIESVRAYVLRDVAPHLGTMTEEVRAEIDALERGDPRRRDLLRLEGLLLAWEANPDLIVEMLEGRRGRRWTEEMRDRRPRVNEQDLPALLPRLARRLEQLEQRHHRLQSQLEAVSVELDRVRRILEHVSAGEAEGLDGVLHDGRGPWDLPGDTGPQ